MRISKSHTCIFPAWSKNNGKNFLLNSGACNYYTRLPGIKHCLLLYWINISLRKVFHVPSVTGQYILSIAFSHIHTISPDIKTFLLNCKPSPFWSRLKMNTNFQWSLHHAYTVKPISSFFFLSTENANRILFWKFKMATLWTSGATGWQLNLNKINCMSVTSIKFFLLFFYRDYLGK